MNILIRPYVLKTDDEVWIEIANRVDKEDPEFVPTTVEEFRVLQQAPFFQARGRFLAELDHVPVGLVNAHVDPDDAKPVGRINGPLVLPEARRSGVGSALLEAGLASLRERNMERARCGLFDFRADGIRFVEKRGFERVRVFSDMRAQLNTVASGVGEDRAVTLEAPPRGKATAAVLVRLSNDAFSEHFGHRDVKDEEEEFWQERAKDLGYRDFITFARLDDEPVGFMIHGWNEKENRTLGIDRGWVYSIGVLKPWRGRGIAKRLLIHALTDFRDRGMTEAKLGVDNTNVTGAFRLYEKVGFKVSRRSFTYEKSLG